MAAGPGLTSLPLSWEEEPDEAGVPSLSLEEEGEEEST
jgi:hypothetical protein